MNWRRNKLVNLDGWFVENSFIDEEKIDKFNSNIDRLFPVRAINSEKSYAEGRDIEHLGQLSIWWSQQVTDWSEFCSIEKDTYQLVKDLLEEPALYSSDVVTVEPSSKIINPHVDTPHRFAQWNFDRRLLSVQLVVALDDIDRSNGSTGLVGYSQSDNFPIENCYQGLYNSYFLKNVYQPSLPKGSALYYNSRVLHSSMPNHTNQPRHALLIQYCESAIVDELRSVDNIWSK